MTLHLTLKKKWFDMILRGEKTEEYRAMKPYWIRRLLYSSFMLNAPISGRVLVNNYEWREPLNFKQIEFKNGYGKNAPRMTVECKGINIGISKPEWCDDGEKKVFVIKLGNVLHHMNCNPLINLTPITREK